MDTGENIKWLCIKVIKAGTHYAYCKWDLNIIKG